MAIIWKVVELSFVSDVEIEQVLNEWTRQGFTLDNIQFAMRKALKRFRSPGLALSAYNSMTHT